MIHQYIILFFTIAIILSSGCISEKEFSSDELAAIALNDTSVTELINGYEYEITDSGLAELNGRDIYYIKVIIDTRQKTPIPYSVFIDKSGKVIRISKEFPTIDPDNFEH